MSALIKQRKVLSQHERVRIPWPAADFPSMGSNSQRWNEAALPSRHNQIGSCMQARRV